MGQGGEGSQVVREGEEGNGQGRLVFAWSDGLRGLWVLVLRAMVWIRSRVRRVTFWVGRGKVRLVFSFCLRRGN